MGGQLTSAQKRQFGKEAEQLSVEYLMRKGYVIRERNWRPEGSHLEVDIITQKGDTIIFVEVKSRLLENGDPMESITPKKIRNLVRAAERYLQNQQFDFFYRFDEMMVTHGDGADIEIEHIEDAFLPPLVNSRL